MHCTQCGSEFAVGAQVCPACGFVPISEAQPGMETMSQAGPGLGTTISVSGSSSIRSRLRPRDIGAIISEAFNIYIANFRLLALLALMYYVPVVIAGIIQIEITPDRGRQAAGGLLGLYGGLFVITIALTVFAQFKVIRACSDVYLNRPCQFPGLLGSNNRFAGYVGASLLTGLAIMGVACVPAVGLAFTVPMVIHGFAPLVWLGVILCFLAAVAVMLVASSYLAVGGSAAAIEGTGARESLTRSATLVKGFFGRTLLFTIIAGLVCFGIIIVFTIPATCLDVVGGRPMLWVGTAIRDIGSALIVPLQSLMMVLYYYDLRIRKEGFDLQMLAEQLGYSEDQVPAQPA